SGRRRVQRLVRRSPSIAVLPQKKHSRLRLSDEVAKLLQRTDLLGIQDDFASEVQPIKVTFLHAGANLIPIHFAKGRQDLNLEQVPTCEILQNITGCEADERLKPGLQRRRHQIMGEEPFETS